MGPGAMGEALFAGLLPALVAAAVIAMLRKSAVAARLADRPNERSLHATPTPRIGGIGVMVACLPAAFFTGATLSALAGLAALLALVSLADDFRSLPVSLRLGVHAAAAMFALTLIAPGLHPVALAAAVLAIVWMTNLFNFMDGADGLAGGMAAIGFATFAIAGWQSGLLPLAAFALAIASASIGFLAFNFPPAKVFLGDAGSVPLGFLAAGFGALGIAHGAWPAWFPVLVFSPFIVDATVTLARRALRGERVWRAHREHCYQRLVLAGWSHRRLALSAYAWMLAVAASALAARAGEPEIRWVILASWSAVYAAALFVVERQLPPGSAAGR